MSTTPQIDRIIKARMRIILEAPFFGTLLMRLKMIRDDSVPTFCTDGTVIRYREAFAAELADDELAFVLVHEVAHCAQGHCWRRNVREPRKWNRAADYQINLMLQQYLDEMRTQSTGRHYVDPWKMLAGVLLDPQFAGLATEEIYARLPEGCGGEGGMGSGGDGGSACSIGEFVDAPGDGAKDPDGQPCATEGDWQVATAQAATVAKMRGQLPGSLRRFLDEALAPKVPWREVLRDFIRKLTRDDYSWTRPNKRFLANGFLLPSLRSERMGRLVIAVDTSGSIGPRELGEFQAECQAALDECQPEAIEVVYCDAEVNGFAEFKPGDVVTLEPHGGGGTDFRPVFDWIDGCGVKGLEPRESDELPEALIYLTDGHGYYPEHAPEYPVLWATTDREDVPWGQVVAVK